MLIAFGMCSCGTYYEYIQLLTTKPIDQNVPIAQVNGGLLYEDDSCTIFYNFWENGGNIGFKFYNKTDKIIDIDLNRSFFVKNGVAYDYYQYYQDKAAITTTSTCNSPILSIPPKSYRFVQSFSIISSEIIDCDLKYYPEKSAKINYTKENTPIIFANYISFKIGEDSFLRSIKNEFYVSEVTNYAMQEVVDYTKREDENVCENLLSPEHIYRQKNQIQVYDKYITVCDGKSFYKTYKIFSHFKLYKENWRDYMWDYNLKGYVKCSLK